MARINVIPIASTPLIFHRIKIFTTGCGTIAKIIAKTIGIIMSFCDVQHHKKTKKPRRKIVASKEKGYLNSSPLEALMLAMTMQTILRVPNKISIGIPIKIKHKGIVSTA